MKTFKTVLVSVFSLVLLTSVLSYSRADLTMKTSTQDELLSPEVSLTAFIEIKDKIRVPTQG